MNRAELSRLAHGDHPIAAPLSDEAVTSVLQHGFEGGSKTALDLGCGGGEWLLRAAAAFPSVRAVGIDTAGPAIERARAEAVRRGLSEQVSFEMEDARGFGSQRLFDVVLSVGATHALGGLGATLEAVRGHLAPGGRLVLGEGYWAAPPTAADIEMLGDLDDLAGTVDTVVAAGWTPVHVHTSSRAELDAYEWAWTGSLAAWALDHPGTDDAAQAATVAAEHRDGWLRGYRATFGFVTLVLRPEVS